MRKTCISDFRANNRWFDWSELTPAPVTLICLHIPACFQITFAGGANQNTSEGKMTTEKKNPEICCAGMFRHFLDHSDCHSGNSMIRWESSAPSAAQREVFRRVNEMPPIGIMIHQVFTENRCQQEMTRMSWYYIIVFSCQFLYPSGCTLCLNIKLYNYIWSGRKLNQKSPGHMVSTLGKVLDAQCNVIRSTEQITNSN